MLGTRSSPVRRNQRRAAAPRAEAAVPAQSLTERAYADLEEIIVTLQLPPGSTVSEAMLSARLGIGRTPIREALQRLARERLITVLPQRGIIVSEVNVKTQLKLLEVRRELERLLATCAARRATDEELKRFRELAKALQKAAQANDETTFMRLDHEFNLLCAAAARNEFLSSAMGLMQPLSRRFWYIHYKQVADMPLAARLHADVAQAIAARDEVAAAKASDALLYYLEEFTRATLDSNT